MSDPLFHIGYPKCASTTLQKNLFASCRDIANYGRFPTANVGQDKALEQPGSVLRDDETNRIYNFILHDTPEDVAALRALLARYRAEAEGQGNHLVFSDESVMSTRFCDPDLAAKARRLRLVFGAEARILVIFREQSAVLSSLYGDYPFIDTPQGRLSVDIQDFALSDAPEQAALRDSLRYNRTLALYQEVFTPQQVLFVPLELLRFDARLFAEHIAQFSGLSYDTVAQAFQGPRQNVSQNTLATRYRALRLRMLPGAATPAWMKALKPVEATLMRGLSTVRTKAAKGMDPGLRSEIRQHFSTDNRMLQSLLPASIDLAALGYEVTT